MCMKRIEMARLTGIPVALAAAERRAGQPETRDTGLVK